MTKAFWLAFKKEVDKNLPHTNKTLFLLGRDQAQTITALVE